jgi:hypothetical protein
MPSLYIIPTGSVEIGQDSTGKPAPPQAYAEECLRSLARTGRLLTEERKADSPHAEGKAVRS